MKKIFTWGTGHVAEMVFNQCRTLNQYKLLGVIDNDGNKWGQLFHGMQIESPEIFLEREADAIVILSDCYSEIKQQIERQYPKFKGKIENKNFFYKESLLLRYRDNDNTEIAEVIEYIKKNGLDVFNYPFAEKYRNRKNQVLKDEECGLFFLIHNEKKMYFSRDYKTEKEVNDYYNSLLKEQDELSPHRYLTEECCVNEGDVVLDVGVAEGNFSLDVIDRASHIYLIETDDAWIEALQYTFKDYMEKITLIKGYVGSYNEGENITVDAVINTPVNFIKMDIEGNEWDALRGSVRLIHKSKNLKMAVCAYHSDFDQKLIEGFMDENDITHTCTKGYMWFPETWRQTYVSTSLNRGIIRGIRNE